MNVGHDEQAQYHKRITSAMDYIQAHIDQSTQDGLHLDAVAHSANMSPFHFHRVFKSVVGETVAEYIRRLKLERSAGIFFYFKRAGITEVAIALGFSSSQNFAKSFKKYFSMTPSDVRALTNKQMLKTLIHHYRKNGNANSATFSYSNDSHITVLDQENMNTETVAKTSIETAINTINPLAIIDLPARSIIYKRLIGQYGDGAQEAAAQLQAFAVENKLATGDPLVINWDNPEITSPEKCRTDVSLTMLDGCRHPSPYNTQTIESNSHAVIRGIFDLNFDYEQAWGLLFSELFKQGCVPLDTPCYKVMHLATSDPMQGLFDISFCQAIGAKNS